MFDFLLTTKC